MSYTYFDIDPILGPSYKPLVRRTRGEYVGTTEPCGPHGFRYAVFRNRASEVRVPVQDLTPETKEKIAKIDEENTP